MQQLTAAWGQSQSPWDLNHDGTVNVTDLLMLISNWSVYAQGSTSGGGATTTTPTGPLAQWVSAPAEYQIGSGAKIVLQPTSSFPSGGSVVFQTWSDAANAVQGAYTDQGAPYEYPASALDQVSPGGAEIQALVRSASGQNLATIRANVAFLAAAPPPPPPPSTDPSSGTGTVPGAGSPTSTSGVATVGVNPGANANAPSPAPAITLMGASGQAPFTVHAHALASQLGAGDVTTARFEWDFGDAAGEYNNLAGFNAAHVYDNPGTYTITLKVINEAGKQATASAQVTVAASQRTVYYVADNGNDASPGTSPSAPIRTAAKVAQLMGPDREFRFRRAGTYDLAGTININAENVVIGAYGNGAAPALRWTAGGQYAHILSLSPDARNVTVQDVQLTSTIATTLNNTMVRGMQVRGNNVTVRHCVFDHVSYAMNAEAGGVNGWLTMGNNAGVLGAYYAWCEGADICHVGNTVAGSVDEHNIRFGGAQRVLVAYNDLTNTGKSTIWCMLVDYATVIGNKLHKGRFLAGPNFATSSAGERARWLVFEGNEIFDQGVILYSGLENASLRNNIIHNDGGEAFSVWGFIASYDRTVRNVAILNNTAINNATSYGRFVKIGRDAENITVANNLYRAPSLNATSGAANAYVDDSDLAGQTFRNNLWATPKTGSYPHILAGAGQSTSAWAANAQCISEHYRQFTVSDLNAETFVPAFSVDLGQAISGVLVDFNGVLRPVSGTVSVGAIEVAGAVAP